MNRLQLAEQFRKALQFFARTLTDEQAIEVATVFDAWAVGVSYSYGDFCTYGLNGVGDPQLYKVNQAHTSQADWTPDATPALYSPIGLHDGYPDWSQPTGAHDAYNTGDIVWYDGQLYISMIDGNVFAPGVVPGQWELYTP